MSGRGTGTVRAAVSSIRSRPMTFVAGFVSIFLGAVVVGSFTSLLATGLSSGDVGTWTRKHSSPCRRSSAAGGC